MDQQLWCQSPGNSGARPIFSLLTGRSDFCPAQAQGLPKNQLRSLHPGQWGPVWTGLELTAKLGLFVGIKLVPLVYLIHLRME